MRTILWAALIVIGVSISAAQTARIEGPTLGFVPELNGTAIRSVIGIPGASVLGDRIDVETQFRGAVVSPNHDYAVASRTHDGQVIVIDLTTSPSVIHSVHSIRSHADVIAISPSGSAAAIYQYDSKAVRVIRNLPKAPELIHEWDASGISGRGLRMTISDDAAIGLVQFADEGGSGFWVLSDFGAPWRIPFDRPAAAAFFPQSQDAIVLDEASRTAFIVRDVGHTAIQIPLVSAPDNMDSFSGVSVSDDGRRVFLTDARSGVVGVVDMDTRQIMTVSCQCAPTGLHRLKGNSAYRLTDVAQEPIAVLDVGQTRPRVVVIPSKAVQQQ